MISGDNRKVIEILLVEDNRGDAHLMKTAFEAAGASGVILRHVDDGERALGYIRKQGEYDDCNRPDIIILDLNLPGKNGREVLVEIKEDPEFRRIPVLVFTTSIAGSDIKTTYDNHANCYMAKPTDVEKFMEMVNSIVQFWVHNVILPQQ
jgi:CheY-like chemotaxis protein